MVPENQQIRAIAYGNSTLAMGDDKINMTPRLQEEIQNLRYLKPHIKWYQDAPSNQSIGSDLHCLKFEMRMPDTDNVYCFELEVCGGTFPDVGPKIRS